MKLASYKRETKSQSSFRTAIEIMKGSLRLLKQHPILMAPMGPIFIWIIGLEISFLWLDGFLAYACVALLAVGLIFAFAINSVMLRQIHEGKKPSLGDALLSKRLWNVAPSLFLLAVVWYGLVLILVSIETLISALLGKLDEKGKLADRINRAIFGTIGDALRLLAIMMVPIIVFEEISLPAAFRRLRGVLAESPIKALSGLALTKMASGAIAIVLYLVFRFLAMAEASAVMILIGLPLMAAGWFLAIYLEQLFVTGLYLYSAHPSSPLVTILLERQLGRELPWSPAPKPV